MTSILLSDENPKTMSQVIKCLETEGFNIILAEDNMIKVGKLEDKSAENQQREKSKTYQSIFPSISRINKLFDYIELNFYKSIKLKDVAEAMGYNPSYLTDLVRKLSGKTVKGWIIQRRIVEARRLLLDTDNSVEQIAMAVGYNSLNLFYAQFHKYNNKTPDAWRKVQRGKLD